MTFHLPKHNEGDAMKTCEHCHSVIYKDGPCGCPSDPREELVHIDLHLLSDNEFKNLRRAISIALNECMDERNIPSVIAAIDAEREVRDSGLPPANCYFCDVVDGNEIPFDPDHHKVCLLCAAKLRSFLGDAYWELFFGEEGAQ